MDAKGLNFTCTSCHTTTAHHIAGREYAEPATTNFTLALPKDDGSRIACASCHSQRPHKNNDKLNDHTDKVACETCHIPAFARVNPTKTWWDWSKAGQFNEDGSFIVKKDDMGQIIYHTKKGEMRWEKNVIPEYRWYDGSITHVLVDEMIDDTAPVQLTKLNGGYSDPNARIYPFKVFKGKQPYDSENKTLVVPKLFGPKGSGAYWKDFDWLKSLEAGGKEAGTVFSKNYGFLETHYLRPIAHMVGPKELSLHCSECHTSNGRLEKLTGFYIPARDKNSTLDLIGWGVCLVSLGAACLHGVIRIVTSGRRNK